MFTPVSLKGKLFKLYLRSFNHPAKIRIQNTIGRRFFTNGLKLIDHDDTKFIINANDWITRIFMLEGNYESESVSLAKNLMKNGGTFVDVGANFGLFTCQVANANYDVRVIAVEPNYKIVESLLKNIQLNELQARVRVVNAAISKKVQLVSMLQGASDNLGTTKTSEGDIGAFSVLSSPLEYILDENKLSDIELLKIDIEGNEFDVIENFPFNRILVKNILLEYNQNAKLSFSEMKQFFINRGFKCLTIFGQPITDSPGAIPENNIWFAKK